MIAKITEQTTWEVREQMKQRELCELCKLRMRVEPTYNPLTQCRPEQRYMLKLSEI